MHSDGSRRGEIVSAAAVAGFYAGVILGLFSAISTMAAHDPVFSAWGGWIRLAMVTWAALIHGLVLGAATGLAAFVLRRLWERAAPRSPAPLGGAARHPGMSGLSRVLRLRTVHLAVAVALLALLEGFDLWLLRRGEGGDAGAARTNLVLIVVDALRADRLGCYGHAQPTSPHIDALARAGVTFERAVVQYPATGPSFGSLFTGKYPRKHGLSGMDPRLWLGGDFNLTLAEILSSQGYETGAIITGSLTRSSGLARGFETLFEEMPAYGTYDVRSPLQTLRSRLPVARAWVRWRRGADPKLVTSEAERWLERKRDERFFLFLHLYDTHAPYDPPREYVDLARPGGRESYLPISSEELRALAGRVDPLSADEVRRLDVLYDGEVRAADASVGRIVEKLGQLGLLEKTVIALTADHGEELYDHRKLEHGHIFNTNLLVPLILSAPGVEAGRRIESPVELIDLLPTLLTMLGVAVPRDIDGTALPLGAEDAAAGEAGYAFAEADCGPAEGKACLIAVQDRRWKLTLDKTRGRRELFDLEGDPFEHTDVLAENPEVGARLEAVLRKWDSTQPDLARLRQRYEGVEISEEIRERLRQLGYIE